MEMVWTYDSLNFHGWDMSVSHDSWKVPSKISTKKRFPQLYFHTMPKKIKKQEIRLSFAGFHFQTYVRI